MAEKRVSVRLAAIGGKQVRAEMEGVGDAGTRGFGRLSSEMERANARLAAFSARVKIAAAMAVAAAAAAGIAMVRSGLETIDAQANLAQDANDRFIFRTTDQTLWFDVDGTGGGGPRLIADLQAGAVVTAADILLL